MQHDEFIGLVQDRARLDSRGAAASATRATLEVLAERLAGGLAENLGAQLPPEIGRSLRTDGNGESFGLQDYWQRVAGRESYHADLPEVAFHTRAVLSVVDEAVTGDQLDRVRDQLTPEWAELFDFSFADRT